MTADRGTDKRFGSWSNGLVFDAMTGSGPPPVGRHVELVDYAGREETGIWCNDGWSLLTTPWRSGISNAVQDVLNGFADTRHGGSPAAKEIRARSRLLVHQVESWGSAGWVGPSVLALSRHGRAEFELEWIHVNPEWHRNAWPGFAVARPRFGVLEVVERRRITRERTAGTVTDLGDVTIELISRARLLFACCASRHDCPQAAVDAVGLLHKVASAANSTGVPAQTETVDAARRLFDTGYAEYRHRSRLWPDTASDKRPPVYCPNVANEIPPPVTLQLAADELAGLTKAYVDLEGETPG